MSAPTEFPPQPTPNEDTLGFWQATAQGHLELCRCQGEGCGRWLQPALERCPSCFGETAFETVSGKGEVYSYIVVYQPAIPGYRDKLPYVVAVVELDEQTGLRLPGRIVDAGPEDVAVGDRVGAEVVDHPGGEFKVAVFRVEVPTGGS
jgi:uncharacterized OB-fold protein